MTGEGGQPNLKAGVPSALVLIVDDDEGMRELASHVLAQEGFAVEAVADGAQAVMACTRAQPDLVLLDANMPHLDGYAVLATLRAMRHCANIPVVMMTGLDDANSINHAYEAGATDFITKPLNWFLLPHRIRYILRGNQTEAALRKSEELFRAIFQEADIGIAQVDLHGRFMESNSALEELLGYTADELCAMTVTELTHPDDRDADQESYQELMVGKRDVYRRENRYYRRDGQLVWAHLTVSAVWADGGKLAFAISMFEDITARKQVEEALRANEERYRIVVEGSLQGISIVSVTGRRLFANPALLRIFGYASLDEYLQRHGLDLVAPHERERVNYYREALMRHEMKTAHYEFEAQRADGSPIWLERMATCIMWNGEAAVLSSILDITPRKQAEDERRRLQQELLDISRQAGMAELATNVLHNVGNVLNSINVSASLLTEQFNKSAVDSLAKANLLIQDHVVDLGHFVTEDERGKHFPRFLNELSIKLVDEQQSWIHELDSMVRHIDHIKEVVAMQQSYARVSGLQEEISLEALTEDALRTIAVSLRQSEIELVRDFSALPTLWTDKHKVLQILVNLLANAKDALGDMALAERRLVVRLFQPSAHRVAVEVTDTGSGISASHLTRIFEYGFTTKPEGHGFGLHSCGLMAKELGGELTARSEGVGCGSAFRLEIPVDKA